MRHSKKCLLLILVFIVVAADVFPQKDEDDRRANTPIEPFRIAANVYYVGAAEVTSFLITSPNGHILIDSGYAETVPLIEANVAKLGFKLADIKVILNTQCHYDHAGGIAALKQLTGAKIYASEGDKSGLEQGGIGDFAFGDRFPFEKVTVDKIIRDGEIIRVGDIKLKTIAIPGHTKGSTAWMMKANDKGRDLNILFFGSLTAPGYKIVGNSGYPNIVADYRKTFARAMTLKPDIFLASHGSSFDLLGKVKMLSEKPSENPFIESKTFGAYIETTEKAFNERLVEQMKQSPQ